ncbi:MAG: hypothetical protein V1822_00210 [Candidatus Micrarchaeota archaeon]
MAFFANKVVMFASELFFLLEVVVSLVFLISPVFVFKMLISSTGIQVLVYSIFGMLVTLLAIFSVVPAYLARITPWDYWQRVSLVLSVFALLNGILILKYGGMGEMKEFEVMQLGIFYLGGVLILIPTSIKYLKEIFPQQK